MLVSGVNRRSARRRTLAIATGVLAAALASAFAPVAMAVDPWPSEGANPFNSRYGGGGAPTTKANLKQLWSQRGLDGDVLGTPILTEPGYVYVGTTRGVVYALSRSNGAIIWARNVGGPIRGSLLSANGSIFAVASTTGSPKLVSLHPVDGTIKWTTQLDSQRDADAYASPQYSAAKNLVYVGTCACGADDSGRNTTFVGQVAAVNATSGALVWRQALPVGGTGAGVRGAAAVYDGINRLFVGTGHAYSGTSVTNIDSIVALDTGTGQILGRFQIRADDVIANSALDPTKRQGFTTSVNGLAIGGVTYIGAGARNGVYYAIDPVSMAKKYEALAGTGVAGGGILAPAAYGANRVYGVTSAPTIFFGLNSTGAFAFRFPGTAPYAHGPITFSRNSLWSTDEAGFLDVHDYKTGALQGRTALGVPTVGGVSVYKGVAYVVLGMGTGTGGGVMALK